MRNPEFHNYFVAQALVRSSWLSGLSAHARKRSSRPTLRYIFCSLEWACTPIVHCPGPRPMALKGTTVSP